MSDNLLNSYDYFLPKELIATHPAHPADSAKLLVYDRKKDEISHHIFSELNEILPPCAVIFNDTKVFKARLFGKKESGGNCEIFINKILPDNEFLVQIRGKVKIGSKIILDECEVQVCELFDDGTRLVKFCKNSRQLSSDEVLKICEKIGHTPLPPYIKREDNKDDEKNYQSLFAKNIGAVAAPTASLHFTPELLQKVKNSHPHAFLTLHVGAGTFASVECENIHEHKMHSEYFLISDEAKELIDSDLPLLGVGTTATRTIEFYARTKRSSGECDLFLHPFNKPIRQNYLLTNFHLPKSTLIMLVSSFIGREKTLQIYEIAKKHAYKFYSYGDAMLII